VQTFVVRRGAMTPPRRLLILWWRIANPPTRLLAGRVPWWVLLETTGCRSGRRRRTPLATGAAEDDGMWLIAVHGRRSGWVRNLEASPQVRLRHHGRWRQGTAGVHPIDAIPLARFNAYARSGPTLIGVDPLLVRVAFSPDLFSAPGRS
jgi:deazaflavin-dependent oxidoreductase (nitroreductase family)